MRNRDSVALVLIVLLTLLAVWIDLPIDHPAFVKQALFWQQPPEYRDLQIKEGLDLQGGTQVLLQAQPSAGQSITASDMQAVKTIVEQRVNGLGVSEPLVQLQGSNRLIVELPGINDPDAAVQTLKSTGQLEFVEIGTQGAADTSLVTQGVFVRTSNSNKAPDPVTQAKLKDVYPDKVFNTLMTGRQLKSATTQLDKYGGPSIGFVLTDDGAKVFGDYTASHVGTVLAIVLDNVVLSAPVIQGAIPDGSGEISGKFTKVEADNLSVQMRYGALPVPMEVVDRRSIGATLGSDSVRKSIIAGLVGLITILVFMIVQYRLPGVVAAVALVIYAALNLMIYKLVPVTLTLPGIAGFLLSTGMAVDANILIFERMKEELRWGRSLQFAVDAAFHRAWPSIRDSNLSTIITCLVLVMFGRSFGAQSVMGFALNMMIGVMVSMFTAVTISRTIMRVIFSRSDVEALKANRLLLDI
jgi:preprotein translocase subunit SecD